jgi:hypothetical protein
MDYQPQVINESEIRNWTSPPIDYDDVSTAEILLKIEAVEEYVKRRYFRGSSISTNARIPVILLVVTNLLSNPTLAKKYCNLISETLGDYSYQLAPPGSNPNTIIQSWQEMAYQMLKDLQTPTDYEIRLTNE